MEWLLFIGPDSPALPPHKTDQRTAFLLHSVGFTLPSNLCPSTIEKDANLELRTEKKSLFKAFQLRLISSHTFSSKKLYYHFPRNTRISQFFSIWFPFINFTCLSKLMSFCLLQTRTVWAALETISSNEFP